MRLCPRCGEEVEAAREGSWGDCPECGLMWDDEGGDGIRAYYSGRVERERGEGMGWVDVPAGVLPVLAESPEGRRR